MENNGKFWNFINVDDDTAELLLYGTIAENKSWWGDEVTPKQFVNDLKALGDKKEITVRINSGGGDVFAANAIYTALKDNAAKIITKIDGIAASAATIVAMAGDIIKIPAGAYMMIHNPAFSTWGSYTSEELIKMSETLKTIKEGIISVYIQRTGKTREELSNLMDAETWYTGEEAVKENFADEILFNAEEEFILDKNCLIVNSIKHNLSCYKNSPQFKNLYINEFGKKENKEEKTMQFKSAEDVKNNLPDIYNEIYNAGVTNERERIKKIDELKETVDNELLNKAKYEEFTSAEEVSFEAMKTGNFLNNKFLNDVEEDSKNANSVDGANGAQNNSTEDMEQEKVSNIAKKFVNKVRGGKS